MSDMCRTLVVLLFFAATTIIVRAQDTLPRFSAAAKGTGRILISWHNNFVDVSQISIQRSTDSLKNFTTLLTVPDPTLPENGAVDNRAPNPNFYYRLFVVMEGGKYFFTPSRRPQANTGESPAAIKEDHADDDPVLSRADNQRVIFLDPGSTKESPRIKSPSSIHASPGVAVEKPVVIKKGDSIVGKIPGSRIRQFQDSLLSRTRDTLVFIDGDSLLIKPFIAKEVYRISTHVFTGKYGNIHLSLPDAGKKHYSVKFFDENNKLLFELAEIKDPSLILDKTNFQHAGWFHFELYESDQLKEKNKLFIPKEF